MKATFALLAPPDVDDVVRKLAWHIHQNYRTGTIDCRLPPHISLKQPFHVSDLAALEAYMQELASTIPPFDVTLTELQLEPISFAGTESGVVWLDVRETEHLRHLHNRVNQELWQRFGNTHADYDGEAYHFHMTVMMGGQPLDVYRRLLSDLADRSIHLHFTVREVALFVYDEPLRPHGEYLTYKIVPIGS